MSVFVRISIFLAFVVLSEVIAFPAHGLSRAHEATAESITVVAHPSVVARSLKVGQLRRIFSMRQATWPDGQNTQVFVLKSDHEVHEIFCKSQLSMFPYQLERLWNKLIYSGLGESPVQVANLAEMLERIQQTPGAIGYVPNHLLPTTTTPGDVVVIDVKKG